MKPSSFSRVLAATALLALLVALPVLGGCSKPDTPDAPVATSEAQPTEVEAEVVPEPVDAEVASAPDGSAAEAAPNAPTTLTVRLTWVSSGENALAIERSVPYTPAVATAAMTALLAGPTPQEQATWPAIGTAIPAGTRLLGLSVANGVAKVDLSKEFESGGGTFSVTARLAQVVYTLTQLPTINAVEFYIEGVRVETFSGEGLMLEGPQTIKHFEQLLPMDA